MKISGSSDRRFEQLEEAFEQNFLDRGEIGAAIALNIEGEQVLSLWGGWRDREKKEPWCENTLTNVYSTTKGVAATVVAMLVSRGCFRYEDKVADYWPEFAAHRKEHVTIGMLMSHQSGLSGFREPVTVDTLYDARAAAAKLADMEPLWAPGTGFGYHPITVGFLVDELCIRATGSSIATIVAECLTPSFHEGLYIGCPRDQWYRAAKMYAPSELSSAGVTGPDLSELQLIALANPILDPELPNSSAWRSAVIASANGFASARGLSALYGSLVSKHDDFSTEIVSSGVLTQACTPQVSGADKTLMLEARWGCGYLVNSMGLYGPEETAFGHSGWGGSFAFADPVRQIGFSYVMNKMGVDLVNDLRNVALVEALYRCFE